MELLGRGVAPGEELSAPSKCSLWSWRLAFAASLLVHLALGYFFISHALLPGAIEQPTEAISIELAPTKVLEAIQSSPSEEAAASSSATPAAGRQAPVAETAAAASEAEPIKETQPASTEKPIAATEELASSEPVHVTQPEELLPVPVDPEPVKQAQPAAREDGLQPPVDSSVNEAMLPPPAPEKTETKESKERQVKEPPKHQTAREAIKRRKEAAAKDEKPESQSTRRSASARGAAGPASSARVSAMSGSAVNYAAMVRARIASNRPGASARGMAIVSFGISPSGSLRFARLARSSGNASLDQAALGAVRRASPFPPPPPGASTTFTIPFNFR